MVSGRSGARRLPPHTYFVVSAVFHYLGPAFAVLLFARVDVLGVAWLRIATGAAIFAVWRRPWRRWRLLDRPAAWVLVAWAAVLAAMNSVFYLALERLPLGTVAAIEFLPVVALAAVAARTRRNLAALLCAVAGVYLLTDVRLVAEPAGFGFAVANAVLFALYIVLGHRVARDGRIPGIDGLALSMLIAAVIALPIGVGAAIPAFTDVVAVAAAVGVGVSSSVIPYVSDQLAMARLPRATYALMVSLLPATATVVGILVLAQIPSAVEIAGVLLVVAGVAVHRERVAPGPAPDAPHTEGMTAGPAPVPMLRCPRCGHLTRADRMVKGYGRDCATQLGLVGRTVDTGHAGPDLLDLLDEEPDDHCDGGDRPADLR